MVRCDPQGHGRLCNTGIPCKRKCPFEAVRISRDAHSLSGAGSGCMAHSAVSALSLHLGGSLHVGGFPLCGHYGLHGLSALSDPASWAFKMAFHQVSKSFGSMIWFFPGSGEDSLSNGRHGKSASQSASHRRARPLCRSPDRVMNQLLKSTYASLLRGVAGCSSQRRNSFNERSLNVRPRCFSLEILSTSSPKRFRSKASG